MLCIKLTSVFQECNFHYTRYCLIVQTLICWQCIMNNKTDIVKIQTFSPKLTSSSIFEEKVILHLRTWRTHCYLQWLGNQQITEKARKKSLKSNLKTNYTKFTFGILFRFEFLQENLQFFFPPTVLSVNILMLLLVQQ